MSLLADASFQQALDLTSFLDEIFAPGGPGIVGVAPGGFLPPNIAFADDPLVDATRSFLVQNQVDSLASSPVAVNLLGPDFLQSLTDPSAINTTTTTAGLPTTTSLVNGILNSPGPVSSDAVLEAANGIFLNGINNPSLQAIFGFDPSSPFDFGTQAIMTLTGGF